MEQTCKHTDTYCGSKHSLIPSWFPRRSIITKSSRNLRANLNSSQYPISAAPTPLFAFPFHFLPPLRVRILLITRSAHRQRLMNGIERPPQAERLIHDLCMNGGDWTFDTHRGGHCERMKAVICTLYYTNASLPSFPDTIRFV